VGSVAKANKWRPVIITTSLGISVVIFTLILKVSTIFINVPPGFWSYFSGGIILVFGILTLFPEIWEKLSFTLKLYRTEELMQKSSEKGGFWGAVLIGMSLGPVFASCSPTYTLILATVLPENFGLGLVNLVVYALGLSLIMMLVAVFGQRLVSRLKWLSNPKGWFKRILGILFIVIGFLVFTGYEKALEQKILDWGFFDVTKVEMKLLEENNVLKNSESVPANSVNLAPELVGIQGWINSNGETLAGLRGKVVLIDFWTYSCINCIRTIPHLKEWHEKYKDDGLVIIGVHTPEFAFEKVKANVEKAVNDYGIKYPVAVDSDRATWRAYENQYWPAKYFIGRDGVVRHTHFGEGDYSESEMKIRELLAEDGGKVADVVVDTSVDVPPISAGQTHETYLGYERSEKFAGKKEFQMDLPVKYTLSSREALLQDNWSLGGLWEIQDMQIVSKEDGAKLNIKVAAKDIYLVMGSEKPAKVIVRVDGAGLRDGSGRREPSSSLGWGEDMKTEMVNGRPQSFVEVSGFKLYRLVDFGQFSKGNVVKLEVPEGVVMNAFTFGS